MNDLVRAALTPGEGRVAEALLDGLTNREIAARLGIGERTVKSYLKIMFLKFQIDLPGADPDASGKRILLARQLMSA
jgi:DNA-binding CsgD family transcriptional regulator